MSMRHRFLLFSFWLAYFGLPSFGQTVDDFFNDKILHEIHIDMKDSDWKTLKERFRDNDYYACDMRWRYNGKDIEIPDIAIRSRGTGSRSPVKPGLRVDFDYFENSFKFLGLKSFVLRNNTQDASMMHEAISMAFMRRMGIPASREAYTRLYVNDVLIGLYTIVESIDKTFLKKTYGEDSGYLYKYDFTAGDPGYLFEYRGIDPALYVPKPFKPETHEDAPKPEFIEQLVRTVNQAPDNTFQTAMAPYLDLNAFLLEVAVESFLAEQDGILGDYGINNFYFYRFDNTNKFAVIPWDKSNTFNSLTRSVYTNANLNVLMRRTLAVPSLQAAYIDALSRSATSAGAAGGWLDQEIARVYRIIREAALQDPNKQCDTQNTGAFRTCTNEEFEAEVAFIMKFARERGGVVNAELFPNGNTGGNTNGQQNFTINDRGASSNITVGTGTAPVVGYARIQPGTNNTTPAGMAIFGFRQNNVLVTEAAVPAARLFTTGRIYAEVAGPVNTGLAIANPNSQAANISFYFTDASGNNFGQGTLTLAANNQIARFLNEAPFNGGSSVNGSFTFTSSAPVAVVALRGFTNERSEFLITTLPVLELSNTALQASVLPHFADGGGWTTQIVLVNPTDQSISGTVQFMGQGSASAAAAPVTVSIDGRVASSFAYTIAPRSSVRLRTAGAGTAIQTGSVRIATNRQLPDAVAVFSFKRDGVTVSEAGVPTIRSGSAFRMYVEAAGNFNSGQVGSLQTGLAVVNLSNSPAVVNFELSAPSGASSGLTGSITAPANGQTALFLNQIQGFSSLQSPFQGVLRASTSSSGGIAMIGLRGRYNERGDFLITTTSPVLESSTPPTGELLFPHFVDGGGYTTQFILFSGYAGQSATGIIRYLSQSGQSMDVRIQ